MRNSALLVFAFLGHFLISSTSALQAVQSKAQLISPRSATAAVYDGQNLIYIFGGWYYDPELELVPYADIHAYNISSDTIEVVAQLPRTSWDGVIHHDKRSGDIYLLRGDGTYLWRYVPSTGETHSETEWFGNSASVAGAFTEDNKLVTFGGLEDPYQVYQFDFGAGTQGTYGVLPRKSELCVGIHIPEYNSTFLFAGELGTWNPILMRYDHSTNTTSMLDIVFPSWRHGDGVLVYTGDSVYVIGAAVDNGARGNGFVQWFVEHSQVNFIPVEGLPDTLASFSTVYVEDLNRIYIFGGYDITNVDRSEIWYVDLV